MKKIISFILIAVLMLSMVACGQQPTPTPDETTEPPKEIQWELKDDIDLDIPEMEIEQITFNGSADKFEVIKNPFNFNLKDAKEILSSEYDMGETHWREYVSTTHDEIDEEWVYGYKYDVTEYETGTSKTDNTGITVQTKIDTTISNDASKFDIVFFDIDVGLDAQKKIFDTVKKLLGEVWATYLVYGKDSDNRDQFGDELEAKYQLEDFVQVGSIKLLCSRDVVEDTVRLSASIEREGFEYCTINYGNYVSKYDAVFKYRVENIFPAVTENYKNCHNVFADFFALNNANQLPNSRVDRASYHFTDYGDRKTYSVEIDAMMYDKQDVTAEGDCFTVMFVVEEDNDGNIIDILVRAYGSEKSIDGGNMSEKEMLEKFKPIYSQKISYLLQNIKLFDDQWKVGEMQSFEDTHKLEYFDEELDYLLDVSINPEDYSWNVQLTLPER